jgi:hypothetical protein
MIALIRLFVLVMLVLTLVYFGLSFWSRLVRRRKLGAHYDSHDVPGSRDEFIARGLRRYDRSLRRRLLLLVYILPLSLIALLVYLVNFA